MIEKALWQAYAARFREAHEESLAYRYRPSNETEWALVERYFPRVTFAGDRGESDGLAIDCDSVRYAPWNRSIRWDEITALTVDEKALRGRVIVVTIRVTPGLRTRRSASE